MTELEIAQVIAFMDTIWFKICVGIGAGTGGGLATHWGIGWLAKCFPAKPLESNPVKPEGD